MTVDQEKLYATTDAQVWAEEFMKVVDAMPPGPSVDYGFMIGWFANAIETAKTHARPSEECVVLSREELLQFFGEMALPPWRDHRGKLIGEHVDCAPLASKISEWLDAHDLR